MAKTKNIRFRRKGGKRTMKKRGGGILDRVNPFKYKENIKAIASSNPTGARDATGLKGKSLELEYLSNAEIGSANYFGMVVHELKQAIIDIRDILVNPEKETKDKNLEINARIDRLKTEHANVYEENLVKIYLDENKKDGEDQKALKEKLLEVNGDNSIMSKYLTHLLKKGERGWGETLAVSRKRVGMHMSEGIKRGVGRAIKGVQGVGTTIAAVGPAVATSPLWVASEKVRYDVMKPKYIKTFWGNGEHQYTIEFIIPTDTPNGFITKCLKGSSDVEYILSTTKNAYDLGRQLNKLYNEKKDLQCPSAQQYVAQTLNSKGVSIDSVHNEIYHATKKENNAKTSRRRGESDDGESEGLSSSDDDTAAEAEAAAAAVRDARQQLERAAKEAEEAYNSSGWDHTGLLKKKMNEAKQKLTEFNNINPAPFGGKRNKSQRRSSKKLKSTRRR